MHKCEHLFTPRLRTTKAQHDFESMYTYGLLLLALPCVWACYDGATPVVSPDGHLFETTSRLNECGFTHGTECASSYTLWSKMVRTTGEKSAQPNACAARRVPSMSDRMAALPAMQRALARRSYCKSSL